ncbi:MAG: SUMF1/EgtB/PvdO family nonheme iron enzyme [Paludibacter sp.]|jgi:gliding motility-associated lipoprotein GldJ|nr:SUMF1/EgtB/PvdO family nonheme iron enzyme [Paludibacter sp.]
MKIKTVTTVLLLLALVGAMIAAGQVDSKYSRATGWVYNNKRSDRGGVGYEIRKGFVPKTPPGMVAIEGGTFTMGERGEYITAPQDNSRRRVTVHSFYMDQYEVSNVEWREYVHWMQVVFGTTAPSLIKRAEPNRYAWREELAYNEPYVQSYSEHPAFDHYPVVGVSWEQAMDYCTWRTDRVNEMSLINIGAMYPTDYTMLYDMDYDDIRENFVFNTQKYIYQSTYFPDEGRKPLTDLYGEPRKATYADGVFFPDYRLPSEAEWEYAAYGLKANKKGIIEEGRVYPWSGYSPRVMSKKNQGRMLANFVRGKGDMMGPAGDKNIKSAPTVPVDSYSPNDFGLYNMAGNVNEWVLDVYRSTTYDDFAEYNSFRGNIYTEPKQIDVDELGNPYYDVDSLGRVGMEIIADVRNYLDGDLESQIGFRLGDASAIDTMDITDILRPDINNNARVYKGGSWKDRIYWIDPSTRRYLDQNKSANDIGFRCAMGMVGNAINEKKK